MRIVQFSLFPLVCLNSKRIPLNQNENTHFDRFLRYSLVPSERFRRIFSGAGKKAHHARLRHSRSRTPTSFHPSKKLTFAQLKYNHVAPSSSKANGGTPNIYDYCVIMVENSDQDIQVTFYLTDAHEMNWITEFLDAPFFAQAETEKLFDLINSERDLRGQKIGRFRVDFHRWQPRHAQIIVFSFTPVRIQKGKSRF